MHERELLEMAAKAAGYLSACHEDGAFLVSDFFDSDIQEHIYKQWRPHLDDGDALRLAVNLDMQIIVNRVDGFVRVIAGYNGEIVIEEEFGDDMYAATRLAITRAAAQIGKSMP